MQTELMNQTQLEALVDLLIYATMTDKSLSNTETESLDQDLDRLPWASGISLSSYKNASYARARAASSETSKANYVKLLCTCFDTASVQREAYDTIEKLLKSDLVVAAEGTFLEQLKLELELT